jgi:hypothetical protein
MPKLGCYCGASILDQTDFLPYKGEILKDQDNFAFLAEFTTEMCSYLAAVRTNRLDEWLATRPWYKDSTDESVVYRMQVGPWLKYRVLVYECPECGRLLVQENTDSDRFIPFTRGEPGPRVLVSQHNQPPAG